MGFLGTDIERLFQETQSERAKVAMSPPGVLEAEIGKFFQRRVDLQNADDHVCKGRVELVGEAPTDPYDAKVVLRFDCSEVPGEIFYNPGKPAKAQGVRARHLVSIGEKTKDIPLTEEQRSGKAPAPGHVMIFPADGPVDLSKPLLTPRGDGAEVPRHRHRAHHDRLRSFVLSARSDPMGTRVWPEVKIVAAFTISHSVTLSLAALQVVNLPSAWPEIAIALSIIYVAIENFFTRKVDNRWRDTFFFGFIHSFGSASRLKEIGVPHRAIAPALASFSIGVENGQIGAVLVVLPLLLLIDKMFNKGERTPRLVYVGSGIVAMFGCYWLLVRVGVLS